MYFPGGIQSQFWSNQKYIKIIWNSFKAHNFRFKSLSHVFFNNPRPLNEKKTLERELEVLLNYWKIFINSFFVLLTIYRNKEAIKLLFISIVTGLSKILWLLCWALVPPRDTWANMPRGGACEVCVSDSLESEARPIFGREPHSRQIRRRLEAFGNCATLSHANYFHFN